MKAKKFIAAVFILVLFSTSAQAKITEQEALNDQRIAQYVELTRQYGKDFLPGRYVHLKEILSRVNPPEKILAASSLIIEVGEFDEKNKEYPVEFDFCYENLISRFMTLELSGAVPIMRTYEIDSTGKKELATEDFAVVIPEGENKYYWLLGSTETGDVHYLFPINESWFPKNWHLGKWIAADNSELELNSNGIVYAGSKVFGTYTISDNRILVKTPDDKEDAAFCVYNSTEDYLVVTFTSGPNGMNENAAIFTRKND
ncbi:MAG: hypothetical protein IJ597_08170 [Synergistaceae bacterium]|nr:hypothetical protein [Synergistaceae bacterium]